MKFSRELGVFAAVLASGVLVVVGIMTFHEETVRSRPVVPPYDIFWCAKDADCIVSDQIGCCPCEQAGAQAAITSWHKDDLRRFLKTACRPWDKQVCLQVDLCRNDAVARCVKRRCEIEYNND